ncbi:HAD family hydrolase [Alicyclobacillus ferrooxydans]|uniref:Hydrolase Cof n=1 Tax=Alicyclobacillus ferrooxydans TaxID=471514 RepID=A0A0P9CRR0_9BACL|nr:HAD family hydrolase [Alicyclobacillus ferrooxydans]KPV39344.1 hypothetical protein AN477_22925 [Alicyclobacillus ferrooxydans]
MDFRAVFLDIDGTLVSDQQLVSSASEVVQRLDAKGYKVALCTGRSTVHTTSVQERLGIGHAVYFNGGLAVTQNDVTLSMPLSIDTVSKILSVANKYALTIILHTHHQTMALADIPAQYQPILDSYSFPPIERTSAADVLSGAAGPIYQANVFVPEEFDDVFHREVPECLVYRWNPYAIDLQRLGCDKSIGASSLLKTWNISPREAIHVGDGGNDIGMFQSVGLSIAMGNAADEVKKHASLVTDTVQNHGVLKALESLHLI